MNSAPYYARAGISSSSGGYGDVAYSRATSCASGTCAYRLATSVWARETLAGGFSYSYYSDWQFPTNGSYQQNMSFGNVSQWLDVYAYATAEYPAGNYATIPPSEGYYHW